MAKKQGSRKRPSRPKKQRPQDLIPDIETLGPSTIMSPEAFSKWMTFASSSDFLTPKRRALLKKMSQRLSRDPALLKHIEQVLSEYGDDIHRLSPSQSELERYDFGWFLSKRAQTLVPPAVAAAALAPAAAALAAAHQGGGDE